MTRDEIVTTIRSAAPALKAEGVTKLAIFGARARGDARPDSDLDVLVEVQPDSRFSMLSLIGVEHIIQDATGPHRSGNHATLARATHGGTDRRRHHRGIL